MVFGHCFFWTFAFFSGRDFTTLSKAWTPLTLVAGPPRPRGSLRAAVPYVAVQEAQRMEAKLGRQGRVARQEFHVTKADQLGPGVAWPRPAKCHSLCQGPLPPPWKIVIPVTYPALSAQYFLAFF